jgi:hypothetical protein
MRIKNGLVMVVFLLFVGVAVQPSIAVNPISSDNKEDCNLCPKVSKPYLVRVKRLLNRLETPIFKEKYQELSDRIITLKEMNKEIKQDVQRGNPIICLTLWAIFATEFVLFFIVTYLIYFVTLLPFQVISMIFQNIGKAHHNISLLISMYIAGLIVVFGCFPTLPELKK